jgi:chromosome segregation ATPase
MLEKEVDGLESRIRNQRLKLVEQEQALARLEASSAQPLTTVIPLAPAALTPSAFEAELQERTDALERLASELADQRLYLTEQCERLVKAQEQWEERRQMAAGELEKLGEQLREQAQDLATREQVLVLAETEVQQHKAELAHRQHHLDAWQARLTAQAAAWEGERDRLLAELRGREQLVERRLTFVIELGQRWQERRHRLLERLRQDRDRCEELRLEWAALREECRRRGEVLDREKRALAERALALEQYRQECVSKSSNPRAAERRLERLRKRLVSQSANAMRQITRERLALEKDLAKADERARQLKRQFDALAAAETEFTARQETREKQESSFNHEQEKLRFELNNYQNQRTCYEQQLEKLRDEVERLARLLYEEDNLVLSQVGKAA